MLCSHGRKGQRLDAQHSSWGAVHSGVRVSLGEEDIKEGGGIRIQLYPTLKYIHTFWEPTNFYLS